jgi:PAS domain-containing protein
LTGKEVRFEGRSDSLGKSYSISAYSPMVNYFVAIFQDITEKKRMEEALQESEEKYRALLKNPKMWSL